MKTCVMLYVSNVEESAEFWLKYFDFSFKESFDLGETKSIVISDGQSFSMQFFQIDFIKVVSPMVSLETPSIMFTVDDFEALRQKLLADGFFVGEVQKQGTTSVCNFQDNEGRYFAMSSQG